MDGNLPFLDEEAMPEVEVIEAAEPELKPEPEPEAKGETEAAPPAEAKEEPKHIPITALLDEREKRQELQRKLEALEAKLATQPEKKPEDFYDNPEAFLARQQQVVQAALWNERLNTSEILTRSKAGDDVVNAASEAFKVAAAQSPALAAEFRSQPDPYGYVVKWHKRQSVLSQMGDDPDAWIEAQVQARIGQVQPKPKAPPPSLASAPGTGGGQEPAASGFQALFGE